MSGGTVGRPFVKGLKLSELLYREAVRPILDRHFAGVPYAVARLGPGSDVLDYPLRLRQLRDLYT